MDRSVTDGVRALERGELVVYPTDTLFGLAARATDRRAVRRLLETKGRPEGQSVSIALSSVEEIEAWSRPTPAARRFVRHHLPGPYTVLLRPSPAARRDLPPSIAADGAIGLRVPDHPVARELARRAGPITATSANRHGDAAARNLAEARRAFGDSVRVYLRGAPEPSGAPSILVDLRGSEPRPVPRR